VAYLVEVVSARGARVIRRGESSRRTIGQCNLTDSTSRRQEVRVLEDRLSDYDVDSNSRLALNVLAHKWTLLIALALKPGPLRFTQLRSLLPAVTSQVLVDSLRDLERDGIVVREERAAAPRHVEYALTELGMTLCEPAQAIRAWAEKNYPAVREARRRYDGRAS
jgi:DNA-binding HxlR family transcriptional regulator